MIYVLLRESSVVSPKHLASITVCIVGLYIIGYIFSSTSVSSITKENMLHNVCNVYTYPCQLPLLSSDRMLVVIIWNCAVFRKGSSGSLTQVSHRFLFMSQIRFQRNHKTDVIPRIYILSFLKFYSASNISVMSETFLLKKKIVTFGCENFLILKKVT